MTKSTTHTYTFEISDESGELVDAMSTERKGWSDAHKQARNFFATAEVGETMDVLRDGVLVEQWIMEESGWSFTKLGALTIAA